MKYKMLAAAVAIVASANVSAAFTPGSMVLSVVANDREAGKVVSLSVDLGIQALGFEKMTQAGGDLLVDGSVQEMAVMNFLNTWSGASFTYDLVGTWSDAPETVSGKERSNRSGVVMSATSLVQSDETAIDPATVSGQGIGNTNIWVNQVKGAAGDAVSQTFDPADTKPGGALTATHNLSNLGAQRTTLGMEMALYSFEYYSTNELVDLGGGFMFEVPVAAVDLDMAGTIALSLDGSQLNFTPVPVPAAVWLFGTAVLGFAGFARRNAA